MDQSRFCTSNVPEGQYKLHDYGIGHLLSTGSQSRRTLTRALLFRQHLATLLQAFKRAGGSFAPGGGLLHLTAVAIGAA